MFHLLFIGDKSILIEIHLSTTKNDTIYETYYMKTF